MVKKLKKIKKVSTRALAKSKGYRSGFESTISEQLTLLKKIWSYESEKISYIVPERHAKYTPDFILIKKDNSKMYIETKGYWPASERKKLKMIKDSNPLLDIRILFMDPNIKITKKSKTTYSKWAETHGIMWAAKKIPLDWLEE